MSTINCILLTEDSAKSVTANFKRNNIYIENKKIHVHHTTDNIMIGSTIPIDNICNTEILERILPPPLNTYIYPNPTYLFKKNVNLESLDIKEFIGFYNEMLISSKESNKHLAIYDVPVLMEEQDVQEDIDEEESCEENSEEEEESVDEDDWDVDDDIPPPN